MDLKHPSENEPLVGAQNKTSEESHHSVTPLPGNAEKNWWDKTKPWVELAGIVLIAIYTGFTVRIFYANKKAAGAAVEANKLTQRSLEIAQRPYIVLGRKDGVVAEFLDAQSKNTPPAIAIYFQNSGHLPTSVCVYIDGKASPDFGGTIKYGVKRMRLLGKAPDGFEQVFEPSCPNVGGESIYTYMLPLPFNQETLDRLRSNVKSEVAIGVYPQYCDLFTGYVASEIVLKYFVEYKAFRILIESDQTYMYTHVPDIQPSEYLPNKLLAPCPAPHEVEQYQKRFLRHAGFPE